MHEHSVVQSILDMCLSYVKENNAKYVNKIIISIGQRANIEKTLLISAFDILKEDYPSLCNAKMDIITKELLLECKDCGRVFHSLDNPICACGSTQTFIVQGRDISLESLELEVDE